MIEITGKHNTARVFTDALEQASAQQIRALCDMPQFAGSKIRVMPDVHAGFGCTIGTTMTIADKVVPGMVGVDIGCGMEAVRVQGPAPDLRRLDQAIRQLIPSGRDTRQQPHPYTAHIDLDALRCAGQVDLRRARLSIGTLGGGNHFIELGQDEEGGLWLVVHSGSRHLGHQVASWYQERGYQALADAAAQTQTAAGKKRGGRLRAKPPVPRQMAWVEGDALQDYLHDMRLTQRFADLNRQAMVEVILREMELAALERFTTVHNYIDLDSMVLRKGAVSARAGEKLLIPLNMRDGSLICEGLGNAEWNHSAPHGAGRVMSRRDARDSLSMAQFRKEMAGVYTTSVHQDTLDEAPMAYKRGEDILRHIGPTARVLRRVRPLYNYKAAES